VQSNSNPNSKSLESPFFFVSFFSALEFYLDNFTSDYFFEIVFLATFVSLGFFVSFFIYLGIGYLLLFTILFWTFIFN